MDFNNYKRNRIGTILHDSEMSNSNTKYISVKELDKLIADNVRMIREKEKKEKKEKKRPHLFVYIYHRIYGIMFSDKNRINATVV
jgi:hypothetical protein